VPALLLFLLSAYALLVLALSAAALAGYRMFKPLEKLSPRAAYKVSIIVAAKEEADTLRECLASITHLSHPEKEVIVVCGPSIDGTEAVANEFAGKVTVLSEPERPADWVGKSWACHNGYLRSTGDVLLFTDGDVIHSPESLDVTLANLESDRADLLSVWPQIVTRTAAERVIFPASVFFLCAGVTVASSRRTPSGRRVEGANGQYIMVKRQAYESVGGHEAIKTEVMEDGAMGRAALAKGLEVVNSNGEGFLKVKPYSRFSEAWEAHERFGAGLIPSSGALVGACILTLLYFAGPFLLLAVSIALGNATAALGAAVMCGVVYATMAFFSLKWSHVQYFLLAPISGLVTTAAFATGFLRFRRGGITWKRLRYARGPFKGL
jgi:chlorobactene glucosyltransferase